MYDYLIVGTGLYGAVFAQQAKAAKKTVLMIDKRPHLGGNIYTEDINGVTVHKYGAHIFHTNSKKIWDYVNKFADFNGFINSPIANYKGKIYSLPFNMYTFNQMWRVRTAEEAQKIISMQRAEMQTDPQNLEEQAISLVGREIYETLIKGYTEKQWGRDCKELPASIIKRLPVRFTYNNNYFNARYQGIPIGGYTRMIEKMTEGIDIRLNTDYLINRSYYDSLARKVVYTGPIDAFFDYCFSPLEYRSVRFEVECLDTPNFQGNAVVNYTDRETPWTRIIEHKWFSFGKDEKGNEIPNSVISREFTTEWRIGDEPYYPINDEKNEKRAEMYKAKADRIDNVLFGGRLGEYKYYDMDQVVEKALLKADEELFCGIG